MPKKVLSKLSVVFNHIFQNCSNYYLKFYFLYKKSFQKLSFIQIDLKTFSKVTTNSIKFSKLHVFYLGENFQSYYFFTAFLELFWACLLKVWSPELKNSWIQKMCKKLSLLIYIHIYVHTYYIYLYT